MSKVGGVFLAVVALVASLLSVSAATAAGTWSAAELISSNGQSPNPPVIVVDSVGESTVVWNANQSTERRMEAGVGHSGSWLRSTLTPSNSNSDYRMTVDGSGNVTAVWQMGNISGRALQAITKNSAGTWGAIQTIATPSATGSGTNVIADSAGNLTVVECRGPQILSYTKLVGQSWSGPTQVVATYGQGMELAIDSSNTIHMSWFVQTGSYYQVFYSSKPSGGSWTQAVQLTSASTNSTDADIVSDSQGNITVVYTQGGQKRSISKTSSGTWGSEQLVPNAYATYSSIFLDSSGVLHQTWRYSGQAMYSKMDFGGAWAPATILATDANMNYWPVIAVDNSGNITSAWISGNSINATTKDAGSSSWSSPFSINTADQTTAPGLPSIATGGAGKTVLAWSFGNKIQTATVTNPVIRTPTFSTPVQTEDGFTVNVTNYDAAWAWTPSASAGASVTAGAASGSTLPLAVTGLSTGTSSTLTMTNSRSGYTNGTATVTSAALNAARTPTFGTPVPTSDGFTAEITNYDASWNWTASSSSGSASIITSGATHSVRVTGVAAGQSVTATVTATRTGYVSGSNTVQSAVLQAALTPSFNSVVRTSDGYMVDVVNYDANYTWAQAVDYGNIAFGVTSGSTLSFIVNGLTPGQSGTLTVDTTRSGYANGQSSVLGSALSAALTPTFGSVTRTVHGYTFDVQNYDASWNWSVGTTQGTVQLGQPSGGTVPVTVTNLADGQNATVTVTTTRSGYASGSSTQAGTALAAALTPVLSAPTKTSTGYIVSVTNYDPSWTWSTSATAGTVSQGTASGSNWQLTVTGLSAGQTADLMIDTSRSGYVSGLSTVTSNALSAARTPTFDTPVRTATGYTVNITNYDAGWTWTPFVSTGSVTAGTASGATLPLTVTGVASSASSTLSVDTVRAGYLTGTATVSGTALGAALVPTFDTPVATADGFTVNVTNYNASWTWAYVASAGTLVTGTPSGSTVALTVTGLASGASATITADTTRSGYGAGQQIHAGATRGAQNPVASLVIAAAIGQNVAGSNVTVSATGLQSDAPYSVIVHSTPRTLGSGTATAGLVTTTFVIPSGLEEGWHRMVFTSTAFSGSALEETLYFKVSSAGALLATSTSAPVALATTGNVTLFSGGLIVVLSVGLGLALIRARRRLTSTQF